MRKLEDLTKYVITPNVRFYGGFIYDGEDIFLCDDEEKDEDYELHVTQKILNNVLITDGEKEYKTLKGKQVKEKWHQEVEIEKGQKIIYLEGQGFTLSEYKMITIDEAKDIYELLKGEKEDDSRGNEKKDTKIN